MLSNPNRFVFDTSDIYGTLRVDLQKGVSLTGLVFPTEFIVDSSDPENWPVEYTAEEIT